MARKFFGTDGIRGESNASPMDAETALRVGMAAGHYFTHGDHRHHVVIGKDTRLSGYMIEPSLTAGFTSVGMNVVLVGPMPSPAVALMTRSLKADLGVMISASHNPYQDNGIKLFDSKGTKLSDDVELELEKLMESDLNKLKAAPELLGRAKRLDDAVGRYIEFVKFTFPKKLRLDGLKIVIDCANGAAYKIAPTILWELGAEIVPIGVEPNGFNINKLCGSTHPDLLSRTVRETKAHIGIALDGDADRLIVSDEKGNIVDGDQIMAAIATYWHAEGKLSKSGLVTTQMSNLGLDKYLTSQGIKTSRTQVGDRYVIEAMNKNGANLGGEQSGHIIFSDYTSTGDGCVAALQLLAILVDAGKPASEVLHPYTPLPQILLNAKYNKKTDPLSKETVKKAIASGEKELKGKGRVFIRKSGTEPLIRIMVEGESESKIRKIATSIEDAVTG